MVQSFNLEKRTSELAIIFGENCRRRRKELSISQRSLSQMTGIAIAHLSNIENGRANPTLELMETIAQAVDSPLVSLLSKMD
ncbi:helix-turn-helix domain-containing protein [Sphingobium sp. DEHP117]|uniref:helix-turn-helix domain-containing protein n=1 Tax=Sphingobium sp. DEHP117 TaxID=2993436 RepID=UPI0027D7339C|nr:helix-turn-helix domain-containing protein [Sphingobium sp. DEHP117]MDQ4422182.1 helix-turn-helix domain-containing protein [Sphingobium sp. DEHP117]